jgi:hypothetical protein
MLSARIDELTNEIHEHAASKTMLRARIDELSQEGQEREASNS